MLSKLEQSIPLVRIIAYQIRKGLGNYVVILMEEGVVDPH